MSQSQSTLLRPRRPAATLCRYRYRLYDNHGRKLGEAQYASRVKAGEIIWLSEGGKFRILDVLPMLREEPIDYAGLLITERI